MEEKTKLEKLQEDELNLQKEQIAKTTTTLNKMIATTFARHKDLSEEEYLKRIGFDKFNLPEKQAVKVAQFNALSEMTKEILILERKFGTMVDLLQYVLGENKTEKEQNNE